MTKQMKLLKLMKNGQWLTSLEIEKAVKTIAAGSMAADLRKKGCVIESKYKGMSKDGSQIWEYRMTSYPENLEPKNQTERGWINELRSNS